MVATAQRSRPTRLSVPALYHGVAADTSASIAIEHARLEARITETVVAMALRDVAAGRTVVVFAANPARPKWLAQKWLDAIAPGTKRFTATQGGLSAWSWETRSGGVLWLVGGNGVRKEALPFTQPARVFVLAAHEVGIDLPALFHGVPCVVAGELADRGHWSYRFARAEGTSLHRFAADAIVAAFPDQASNVPLASDPSRARTFDLRDIDESATVAPFVVFARKRLMIVTDERHWLSPLQQRHAEGQFGEPMVPLDLQPVQKRYLARKRLAVREGRKPWFLLLKYRRGGFTTVEQGEHHRMMVTRPRSRVMTLADTKTKTAEIFRTSLLFLAEDPQRPARVNDATTSIELANGSVATIGTAGAHAVTRGLMLSRFHGSEAAFWCLGPNQHRDVGNLIAGVMGAARYGEIVLETTPNGQEWFFTKWQEAKAGANAFTPIFLPWFVDPRNRLSDGQFSAEEIRDTLNLDEQRLIKKHGLDLNQIAFRRKMRREHGVLFAQEYPEDDITCFLSTGTCYFNGELLRALLGELEDNSGKVKHLPGGREIRWKDPVKGRKYVAGADTSEGLEGCDPNGLTVLDFVTGEQVADVHGRFNPRTLAGHIKRVCTDYNDALVGVERENHGHAVLQKLEDLGFNRPHFRGGPLFHFNQGESVDQWRAGWSTNTETRPVMLAELSAAIEERGFKINDRELVQECLAFKLQSSGKFEADPAAHDDRVIKAAIAWQMRKHLRPAVGGLSWA